MKVWRGRMRRQVWRGRMRRQLERAFMADPGCDLSTGILCGWWRGSFFQRTPWRGLLRARLPFSTLRGKSCRPALVDAHMQEPETDPEAKALIDRFQVDIGQLPIVLCPGGQLLREQPHAKQIAA
jgi:hypothetical protein